MGLCRLGSSTTTAGETSSLPTPPSVIIRLIQEIEARASTTPALDLYRLYRTTTPGPEIMSQLRTQLDPTGSQSSIF